MGNLLQLFRQLEIRWHKYYYYYYSFFKRWHWEKQTSTLERSMARFCINFSRFCILTSVVNCKCFTLLFVNYILFCLARNMSIKENVKVVFWWLIIVIDVQFQFFGWLVDLLLLRYFQYTNLQNPFLTDSFLLYLWLNEKITPSWFGF